MRKVARKAYTTRDLAEARAWAKNTTLVDGDNYAHPLDEDPDMVLEIAELIAKVRRSSARRIRLLEDAISNMGYDVDAVVERFRKASKAGEAFWR